MQFLFVESKFHHLNQNLDIWFNIYESDPITHTFMYVARVSLHVAAYWNELGPVLI